MHEDFDFSVHPPATPALTPTAAFIPDSGPTDMTKSCLQTCGSPYHGDLTVRLGDAAHLVSSRRP